MSLRMRGDFLCERKEGVRQLCTVIVTTGIPFPYFLIYSWPFHEDVCIAPVFRFYIKFLVSLKKKKTKTLDCGGKTPSEIEVSSLLHVFDKQIMLRVRPTPYCPGGSMSLL